MSHFLGLLFIDKSVTDDDLTVPVEKMLAPYDENVSVAPYVKYTKDEAYNMVLKNRPEISLEDARSEMEEYGDYLDENMNVISTYNPKSKWDWYAFGGRYLDYLPYPDGRDGGKIDFVGEIDWKRILMAEEDYLEMDGGSIVEKPEFKGLPFVFVDKDGKWHQRGEAGWWGTMDEEMSIDEWREYIKKYVESLDEKDIVVVVDFHI